jgi:hypothetical protein
MVSSVEEYVGALSSALYSIQVETEHMKSMAEQQVEDAKGPDMFLTRLSKLSDSFQQHTSALENNHYEERAEAVERDLELLVNYVNSMLPKANLSLPEEPFEEAEQEEEAGIPPASSVETTPIIKSLKTPEKSMLRHQEICTPVLEELSKVSRTVLQSPSLPPKITPQRPPAQYQTPGSNIATPKTPQTHHKFEVTRQLPPDSPDLVQQVANLQLDNRPPRSSSPIESPQLTTRLSFSLFPPPLQQKSSPLAKQPEQTIVQAETPKQSPRMWSSDVPTPELDTDLARYGSSLIFLSQVSAQEWSLAPESVTSYCQLAQVNQMIDIVNAHLQQSQQSVIEMSEFEHEMAFGETALGVVLILESLDRLEKVTDTSYRVM